MKKIAKLIAISLCLATTTFAMEDASFVEEVDYNDRAVLSTLQDALSVIQDVTPEVFQRLVNKKLSNNGLTDHCSTLCEIFLALQEDAANFGTGLTTFEAILDGLPDSEKEAIDPLTASFVGDGLDPLAASFADFSLMPPVPGSSGENTNQINTVIEEIDSDEEEANG